jgi:hypothetical protein
VALESEIEYETRQTELAELGIADPSLNHNSKRKGIAERFQEKLAQQELDS